MSPENLKDVGKELIDDSALGAGILSTKSPVYMGQINREDCDLELLFFPFSNVQWNSMIVDLTTQSTGFLTKLGDY